MLASGLCVPGLVDAVALRGRQRGRQALGDLQRHLALHRGRVQASSRSYLSDQRVCFVDRIDQFDGRSHAAAIDAHTAFHQVASPKLWCDALDHRRRRTRSRPRSDSTRGAPRSLKADREFHASCLPEKKLLSDPSCDRLRTPAPRRRVRMLPGATAATSNCPAQRQKAGIAAATIVSNRDRRRRQRRCGGRGRTRHVLQVTREVARVDSSRFAGFFSRQRSMTSARCGGTSQFAASTGSSSA